MSVRRPLAVALFCTLAAGCAGPGNGLFGSIEREAKATATVQAAEAAPSGQAVPWKSDWHDGSVTALGDHWQDAGGRKCRILRQQAAASSGGETHDRKVQACLVAEGSWEVVDPSADEDS